MTRARRAALLIVPALLLRSEALAGHAAAIDAMRIEEAVGKYDGAALKAMGREVLPVLVRMYEEGDEERRSQVAAVLYQLGWKSPEAKQALMQDVKTSNESLRINVQYALGRVSNDDDVVDVLLENMQHDASPLLRDKAACSLAYDQIHLTPRQKARLYEGLIEALDSPEPQVRRIALQALKIQTGQTKGFHPDAPLADRRRSAETWRRWLAEYRANL